MYYLLALVVVAPFVVVYAGFLRWVDRYEPEPWWILALCFTWGALGATCFGGLGTLVLQAVVGGGDAIGATFYAPITEESFKGLGVIVMFVLGHLVFKELDGPLDGVIYGGIIGLGFTLTEDTLYIGQAGTSGGAGQFVALTVLRTILGGLAHALYTSMTGLGWGMVVVSRSWLAKLFWPCAGFATAMLMHAFHNALPSFLGGVGGLLAIVFDWILFLGWFVLILGLVLRERSLLMRLLRAELGGLVRDERDLQHLGTVFARSFRRIGLLFSEGWSVYRATTRRERALVELAFLKEQVELGDGSLGHRERELRAEIWDLMQKGAR